MGTFHVPHSPLSLIHRLYDTDGSRTPCPTEGVARPTSEHSPFPLIGGQGRPNNSDVCRHHRSRCVNQSPRHQIIPAALRTVAGQRLELPLRQPLGTLIRTKIR